MSVKSKPKRRGHTAGPHAGVEEGDRAGGAGPVHPDLPGPRRASRSRRPMPIRKPKPTSPGLRFVSYPDFAEITKTEPERTLVEGLKKSGGRNSLRPQDLPPPRRRGQAPVPQDRLQAPPRRDPRQGRRDRVRPEPDRLHRAAALRRRREVLHPGPAAPAGRRDGHVRARGRDRRGQLPAAGQHADGHRRPQRRAPARARRPARPLGRRRHPADGEGGRHGHPAPALRRDAPGPRRVPRDRRARSATPITRTSRSARPAASATWACARRRAARP